MSARELRELVEGDREQAQALGTLAFGGDPAAPLAPAPAGSRAWGVFEGDRLLAKAVVRSYTQWWGGRPVPMGGVAGVAVHPDARGQGTASRLVRALIGHLRDAGQPVSALFPTAPGIYRPLGWEVVGSLDETLLQTSALRSVGGPVGAEVRTADPGDVPVLTQLWRAYGEASSGLLTRDGPSFPRGAESVLAHDVVTLAEEADRPAGYLAYDRGRGYGADAELYVWELVAGTAVAASALLRAAGSWDAVAGAVRWRGPVDELRLLLGAVVPPAVTSRPYMLRVVDAPGAVAARGYDPAVRAQAEFTLVDPEVPGHEGPWRLTVEEGSGVLERTAPGPPRLHVRGLALLYGGAADSGVLRRAGLLDGPVPGLDAFAGAPPRLLDYF